MEDEACRVCGHEKICGMTHSPSDCIDELRSDLSHGRKEISNLRYKKDKLKRQIAALIEVGDELYEVVEDENIRAWHELEQWDKAKGEIE